MAIRLVIMKGRLMDPGAGTTLETNIIIRMITLNPWMKIARVKAQFRPRQRATPSRIKATTATAMMGSPPIRVEGGYIKTDRIGRRIKRISLRL